MNIVGVLLNQAAHAHAAHELTESFGQIFEDLFVIVGAHVVEGRIFLVVDRERLKDGAGTVHEQGAGLLLLAVDPDEGMTDTVPAVAEHPFLSDQGAVQGVENVVQSLKPEKMAKPLT